MRRFAKLLAAGAFWGMAAAALAAPDLVISSITLSTYKAIPGTKVTINSVTRNNGDATGWWKYCDVYYYWGTAGNLQAKLLGTGATPNYQEVNGIDKGEEEEDTMTWTIPEGTAPGIYYITCVADAEKEISESNENNNTKSVKFTVQGTPAFSDLKWLQPLDVSSNDWVSAYGECANLSAGQSVTLEVWQSKTGFDSQVATYTTKVQYSGGNYFFNRAMKASWASGKYYFKASATEGSYSCDGDSGEADGVMLTVSNDRMVPSYSSAKNDFYYDNESTSDPGLRGATSGKVALTDDRIPIILVHGMSGDAKPKTLNYWYGWMNADSSVPLGYFNQSPMSTMFRVYRYVYDSRDNISTNGERFANFVNNFYSRHPEFEGRQVVIMAHSMGGLVSRYAMNKNTNFAAKVHRLVTLGSPHLGAQGANPTWIKYSGPDDNSWFVSSIYNTFNLHNNTAGCFDLAWYATNEIPSAALTEDAISKMGDSYRTDLMRNSLRDPFTGWTGMRSKSADNKCVLFGGSSTNQIGDTLRESWPDDPSGEVKTDHLGLWVATKIYRSMSYADGTGVGDNDGLVPLISALMNDSLKCALASDKNGHPTAAKFNLNAMDGQQVDHASYLDVPVTMDAVKAVLLTQVRGICQPEGAVAAGAAWQLIDNVTGEKSPFQRTEVRLPALIPGRSYTVRFNPATGYNTPKDLTFTATKAVTRKVIGTYTTAGASNHAPSDLALSNASVKENADIGTVVGTLSAVDDDGDTLTFSLVAGDGDTGNACFTIDGNKLKTAQVFDYEQYPQHFCRIRVSDGNGGSMEEAFTIDVIDVDEQTPAQKTGPAWLNLSWAAVPGADYYEVDISAGTTASIYTTPNQSLGTNKFLAGQFWRYEAPGGATTTSQGSVKTSPCWFTYGPTNAHALFGTNGMALITKPLPLLGASAATIDFTHGNWNGGGDTNISRINAYYSIDGGDWQLVTSSVATAPRDGGEVSFWQDDFIEIPQGASTITFKLEAPNAWRNDWQRGPYVTTATASLYGQGDFEDPDVHLTGYPVQVNVTNLVVQNLPEDTPYWWHVIAHVGDDVVDLGYGHQKTETTIRPPTGLTVTTASSTALTMSWTDPGAVDHFEVALTPVLASGTQHEISSVPNIYLRNSENTSGWGYATNHISTTWGSAATWFVSTTNVEWDYHVLLGARAPGIQSPELDLSGYASASLRFVARARASANGVTSVPMVLSYSLDDGQTWTPAASATTNTIYLYNSNFINLELPPEALTESVRLELSCPEATGNLGNGVRNMTLQGVGKPAPDYEAETAFDLEPVPSPLANPVAATATATTTASGLAMNTLYFVHVRAVDALGHVSAWVEASGTTADASAPTELSLSSRSIHEYNEVGEYVGQLSAVDIDEGDKVTYALAYGEGSDDNAQFEVSGTTVRAASTLKIADGTTRHIRVRATDAHGKSTEEIFEIEVLERATPPTDVLVPTETIAAMGRTGGVLITDADPEANGSIDLAWEPVLTEGARTATRYFVYYSTNLMQGFYFLRAVDDTTVTVEPQDAPATFWRILVAD